MFTERLKKLTPYVPGEQPQDREYIKLNTNENPYPPSPAVGEYLKNVDIETLRRYPDPRFTELRAALAQRYGVGDDHVFVGNGSDEVLSFIFYAFFDSQNGPLLFPEFTYSFYPVYCDFYSIAFEKVALRDDFSIALNSFLEEGPSCGLIFPNPNAPTGIGLSLEEITRLLDRYPTDRVVAIDEAYIDFGGESAVGLIEKYPNLIVVRTFSKSMSLAGIRLGFAMGDQRLIKALYTVKDSFNSYPVDTLAQQAGLLAVNDRAYYDKITARVIATRDSFSAALTRLGWSFLPSSANFVFAGKKGVPGEEIYRSLKARGILVRHFNVDGLKDFVRITIGTPPEMEALVAAIKESF
jgi:histidinol-phosphate aminotransferase